jgi:UDP-glucose 4-epimerase
MNILVTGGAGYIGSIVAEELIQQGDAVVVFDNLYYGHRAAVHPQATFVEGDLSDRAVLERMLYWLDRVYGFRYAALRYFNAAGASPTGERGEDHDPETHLIPLTLQVALGQRDKVVIFGDDYPTRDGTCVRDYIHVTDLAQAHILALRALNGGSRTYNLGNGQGFSVREVIETCREVTGHPIPAEIGRRRPGDPATLIASSDKIRRELGWQPQYSELRTIVEHAWEWHHTHPHGYGN